MKSSSPIVTPTSTPRPITVYPTTTPIPVVQGDAGTGYAYPTPKQNSVYVRPHSQSIETTYLPARYNSISSTTPKSIETTYIPSHHENYASSTPKYNHPLTTLEPPLVRISSTTPTSHSSSSTPFSFDRTPISVAELDNSYYSSSTPSYHPSSSPVYHTPSTQNYHPSSTPNYHSSSTPSYSSSIEITPRPYKTILTPTAVASINNELLPPHFASNYGGSISPTTYRPPVAVIHPDNDPHRIEPIDSSSAKPIVSSSYNTNSIENNVQPIFSRPSVSRDSPLSYQYYRPVDYSAQSSTPSSVTANRYYDNQIDDRYQQQQQDRREDTPYDGVSVTNNGFRYFLPRQYHEEENSGSSRRSGSFGYVDPFGIRRVIYYNTSPEGGFNHRKNNRYVGFDAPPYDPRPS